MAYILNDGTVKRSDHEQIVKNTQDIADLQEHTHDSELFIAEYGETTFDEVDAAYRSGKIVKCKYNDALFADLTNFIVGTYYYFTGINNSQNTYTFSITATNGWANTNVQLPNDVKVENVSAIDSNGIANIHLANGLELSASQTTPGHVVVNVKVDNRTVTCDADSDMKIHAIGEQGLVAVDWQGQTPALGLTVGFPFKAIYDNLSNMDSNQINKIKWSLKYYYNEGTGTTCYRQMPLTLCTPTKMIFSVLNPEDSANVFNVELTKVSDTTAIYNEVVNVVGKTYYAGTGIDINNTTISVNDTVDTTDTDQTISGKKTFSNYIKTDGLYYTGQTSEISGNAMIERDSSTANINVGLDGGKVILRGVSKPQYKSMFGTAVDLATVNDVKTYYNHLITARGTDTWGDTFCMTMQFISTSSTAITAANFKNGLSNLNNKQICGIGTIDTKTKTSNTGTGVYVCSGTNKKLVFYNYDVSTEALSQYYFTLSTITFAAFTDDVTSLN